MKLFLAISFPMVFLSTISIAYSATINVSAPGTNCNSTEQTYCSIQTAIDATTENDTILISGGRYFENIVVNKRTTLIGIQSEKIIIDGSHKGSVVTINPGSKASIKNIQLSNGKAINGGGILNKGSLMLQNVEVLHNIASQSGGGIFNAGSISGSLFISNSRISHNQSLGDDKYNVKYGGGGIYNNAPMHINKSIISNNSAQDNGGGIYSIYSGRKTPSQNEKIAEEIGLSVAPKRMNSLTRKADKTAVSINNTNISDNIAGSGGGINLQGVMIIRKSSINNNQAIYHQRSSGGGIFVHLDTTLHISNTTIAYNEAIFRGGGMRFYSTKTGTLNNVSIIYNKLSKSFAQGAGLYIEKHTKEFEIKNSLLAENKIMNKKIEDCYGEIDSKGFNFVGFKSRCNWTSNNGDTVGSKTKIDPKIKWDKKNERYFLGKTSPLINNGSSTGCQDENGKTLENDQFNKPRNDGSCDIGAVEF